MTCPCFTSVLVLFRVLFDGAFDDASMDGVWQVLASLIYSASTLHAAVNFPQKPIMSYPPNTPGSVYVPPPTDKVPYVASRRSKSKNVKPYSYSDLHVLRNTLIWLSWTA